MRLLLLPLSRNWSVRLAGGVANDDAALLTREQVRPWRQQPHIGAALVHLPSSIAKSICRIEPWNERSGIWFPAHISEGGS
jgi:hypothetical protein